MRCTCTLTSCPKKHYIVCSTLSFRPQAFAILAFCYSSSSTFKYSSYISLTNSYVCNFRQTRGVQTGHIDAYISHKKDTSRRWYYKASTQGLCSVWNTYISLGIRNCVYYRRLICRGSVLSMPFPATYLFSSLQLIFMYHGPLCRDLLLPRSIRVYSLCNFVSDYIRRSNYTINWIPGRIHGLYNSLRNVTYAPLYI